MIRILTLNTWKCDGDYAARLKVMRRQLQDIAPDIICLQEVFVDDAGEYDTGRDLANALGMRLIQFPARRKPRQINGKAIMSTSGLAILTNYSIERTTTRPLPSFDDDDRWLMLAELSWTSGRLSVLNTHLTHLDSQLGMRKRLDQLNDVLNAAQQSKTHLTALAGDFNLAKDHQALRKVSRCTGHLHCEHQIKTTLIGASARPIDHIFAFDTSASWRISKYYTSMNLTDPLEGIFASDHCAVVMELSRQP